MGPKWSVLGADQGLSLTVLACLGAKAVGLGRGSGRKVSLARAGKRSGQEIRPKSGPNPSESRIRKRSGPPNPRRPHRPPQAIFQLIDMFNSEVYGSVWRSRYQEIHFSQFRFTNPFMGLRGPLFEGVAKSRKTLSIDRPRKA